MRRLVGIPVRRAVAVALPLVGVIYLAAEARQAVIRHYSVASFQPVTTQQAAISEIGDRFIGSSDHREIGRSTPESAKALPAQNQNSTIRGDELSAEQQASQIPARKSTSKAAKDPHTRQIIISIPDRRLALVEDGQLLKAYAVAVGASETPSPDGEFTIINHAVDPTYRHDGKEIGPGKGNPLGTRWIGLSLKGYGIHGTNVQSSVGQAASHGCFRMKKKDVEELYRRVQVGDAVSIRSERDELTASLFTTGTNVRKPETQIASAATAGATAVEEQ